MPIRAAQCISEKERGLSSSPPFVRLTAAPRQVPSGPAPPEAPWPGRGRPLQAAAGAAAALREPARPAKSALRNAAAKGII